MYSTYAAGDGVSRGVDAWPRAARSVRRCDLCESFSHEHDCLKHLPRVIDAGRVSQHSVMIV